MGLVRHGQSDRLTTPISAELPKWATMSENSATRLLEDGQNDSQTDGMIRASDLRALTAAMTAARDGSFTKVPEAGPAPVAELCALFNQIIDRSTHFGSEVQRVRRSWSGTAVSTSGSRPARARAPGRPVSTT